MYDTHIRQFSGIVAQHLNVQKHAAQLALGDLLCKAPYRSCTFTKREDHLALNVTHTDGSVHKVKNYIAATLRAKGRDVKMPKPSEEQIELQQYLHQALKLDYLIARGLSTAHLLSSNGEGLYKAAEPPVVGIDYSIWEFITPEATYKYQIEDLLIDISLTTRRLE